ncbi:MAG: hypothetical protein KatS3mg102_2914 [Planctomycetota bacterium]|nr:MAG: hypothetical protein KatS3mg102_2914 [Planctomycetota bacterium]
MWALALALAALPAGATRAEQEESGRGRRAGGARETAALAIVLAVPEGHRLAGGWALLDPHPLAREIGVRAGVYASPVGALALDEHGRASARGLAPGSYVVAAGGIGLAAVQQRIELQAGQQAEVRLSPRWQGMAALAVEVEDGAGRAVPEAELARCRLRLIRTADGAHLETAPPTARQPLALVPGDYLLELLEPAPGGHPDPGAARRWRAPHGAGARRAWRSHRGPGAR